MCVATTRTGDGAAAAAADAATGGGAAAVVSLDGVGAISAHVVVASSVRAAPPLGDANADDAGVLS
eukprot:6448170-Prymnesium_polylepis.1